MLIIYAAVNGLLNEVPVDKIMEFERGLREYVGVNAKDIYAEINKTKELSEETEKKIKKVVEQVLKLKTWNTKLET